MLLGLDYGRDVALQPLDRNGALLPPIFSLLSAFPTRVVFLDASMVNADGGIPLAVRLTAQANGSQ